MANVQNSNSFYIDSTGALTTQPNTRVSAILFTANAANDVLTLTDGSGGAIKLKLQHATAKDSRLYALYKPIVFPNGVYVSVLTASATATIITEGTEQHGR